MAWTTRITTTAEPAHVLGVLTEPSEISRWSPIDFELEDFDGVRLEPGSRARVSGRFAGVRAGFDVEVHAADANGLELTAYGPVGIDVRYDIAAVPDGGSVVEATVSLRGASGFSGRLLEKATGALLAAGALDGAAGRITQAAEETPSDLALAA